MSNVTNSTILENPQLGRVVVVVMVIMIKFCDWWIKPGALNMIC